MKRKMIADTKNYCVDKECDYDIKELKAEGKVLHNILMSVLPYAMKDIDDPDIRGRSPEKYISNLMSGKLGDFNSRIILTYEKDESIIGIIIALPIIVKNSKAYNIYTLGVFKHYRNRKIGKYLLLKLIKILNLKGISKVSLDVHDNNIGAIRFYKRYGFNELRDNSMRVNVL